MLDMLQSCGLRAHPDKSIFGADVIEYLGHNLSPAGISPHAAKVSAILALPEPTNVAELRQQIGFISYYRAYIPNASQLMLPFFKLLKKGVPWLWGPEQQAHQAVKAIFAQEGLVVRCIDYDRPFVLHTDFSARGLGAVLSQHDDAGQEYMVACISRSLNKHEATRLLLLQRRDACSRVGMQDVQAPPHWLQSALRARDRSSATVVPHEHRGTHGAIRISR